jgi:hypothetical protein
MEVWVTCEAVAGGVWVTAADAGGERVALGAGVTTGTAGDAGAALDADGAGDGARAGEGAPGVSGVGTNWPWPGWVCATTFPQMSAERNGRSKMRREPMRHLTVRPRVDSQILMAFRSKTKRQSAGLPRVRPAHKSVPQTAGGCHETYILAYSALAVFDCYRHGCYRSINTAKPISPDLNGAAGRPGVRLRRDQNSPRIRIRQGSEFAKDQNSKAGATAKPGRMGQRKSNSARRDMPAGVGSTCMARPVWPVR